MSANVLTGLIFHACLGHHHFNVLVLFKALFADMLVCQTHAAQLQHQCRIVCAADHVLAADMRQF